MNTSRLRYDFFDFRVGHNLSSALLAFVAFGLAAYIGIEITQSAGRVAAIWPANAILFAIIWRRCEGLPVVVLLAAFAANVMADMAQGDPLLRALALSSANSMEVIVAVSLLRWLKISLNEKSNVREIAHFVVLGCLVAPLFSATIAASYFQLALGVPFAELWVDWFVADALGLLTVGPALIFFSLKEIKTRFQQAGPLAVVGSWLVVTAVIFGVFFQQSFPLLFLVFPAIILITYTGGFSSACLGLLFTTVVSIYSTITGAGPINLVDGDLVEKAYMLQLFLAAAVLSMLPISNAITSARRALENSIISQQSAIENEKIAHKANQAKSEFLTSMSHELRTPLNAIYGFSQLLKLSKNVQGTQEHEYIESILLGSRHLISMMDDILDLAKIENRKVSIMLETVNLGDVVEQAVSLKSSVAYEKRVSLGSSPDLHSTYVTADEARLSQVILNILSNAIKYNRPGGYVQIYATVRDERLTLYVEDNGSGISEEHANNVFEAFNRCGAEFGEEQGAGVGLAISKRLVEMMGGMIGYHPKASGGSVFWIETAFAGTKDILPDPDEGLFEAKPPAQIGVPWSERRTVVYVEDNDWNSRLMAPALSIFEGIEVIIAQDAITGLDIIRKTKPDLIILDLHLPDMDGMELLAKIQAEKDLRLIPVFALTADATKSARKRCADAGFDQYISKPFAIDHLQALVREAIFTEDNRPTDQGKTRKFA